MSIPLPLFVAIPLGAAFFIPMVGRKNPRLSDTLANITTLALFLMALSVIGKAAEVYWNSAICPNFTPGDITSNRVTRVLSSGGFCLAESNLDIEHSFTDGVELATFKSRNIPHMIDRIRYYMDKPALRHEIAMRGHEWTRDKSWTHQAEKMVKFIRGEDVPADGAAGEYLEPGS